jgi:hypothetical protein
VWSRRPRERRVHTLGTHLEQFEHLTFLTCPLPFLFRPPPLLFFVILSSDYNKHISTSVKTAETWDNSQCLEVVRTRRLMR